jgi:hypothetical protein
MKHLVLAAALLMSTCMLAFAGEGSKKEENDAAMKLGRTQLTAKIQELEQGINNHNTRVAEKAAIEILTLMRKGMTQTRVLVDLEKGEQQKNINARYLEQEATIYKYKTLAGDVSANGKQLLEQAQSFMKQY